MGATTHVYVTRLVEAPQARLQAISQPVVPRVGVVREGRAERFLEARPVLSSSPVQWRGIALEIYTVPAVLIPRHQHPEHFLHVVLL